MVSYGHTMNGQRLRHSRFLVKDRLMMLSGLTQVVITNNKKPLCTGIQRGLVLSVRKPTEIIMKQFTVCINYGRKCPAFETVVTAATEHDAKHQAQVLARMSGWNETAKKITVKGA